MIVPVILSGGSGTRLWPLSRELYPKQLLPLVEERTMLQSTVTRLAGIAGLGAPLVVCNEDHRFMVAEQLRQVGSGPAAILLEPVGRNTAPAVAVAALQALKVDADPILLVLPADHVIRDAPALRAAVEAAAGLAESGRLITFGIVPTTPETGYGYIRAGESVASPDTRLTAYAVAEFVEKPDLATAERYVASGDYFWNSGMFMFRASRYLEELERFVPEMVAACRDAMEGGQGDLDFIRLEAEAFGACPSDSIGPPRPPSSPSMPAGATSARGLPSGRWRPGTGTTT
jgi:mannose-1-phosphate guanylyltransferase/mannose-6-phosphate isomerase